MKRIERLALWLLLTLGLCGCASGKTAEKAAADVTGAGAAGAQTGSGAQAGSAAGVTIATGRRHVGVRVLPAPDGGPPTVELAVDDDPDSITAGAQGAADAGAQGAADAGVAGAASGAGQGSAAAPGIPLWAKVLAGIGAVLLAAGGAVVYFARKRAKAVAAALLPLP